MVIWAIPIVTGQVFFHFDSARDMLWVRDIVVGKQLTLLGPWASLQGVFYGPLTYYLLAVFFWIFGGNPLSGSVYALTVAAVALILFFFFLKRTFDSTTALVGTILLGFSPITLAISRFVFQSNPSMILGVLILLPLYQVASRKLSSLPYLFFIAGLGVQTNFFWTVFVTPFLLVWLLWLRLRPSHTLWFKSGLFFLLPLIPHMTFELRNNFFQTRSLWLFVMGENKSLGNTTDLADRINERFHLFGEFVVSGIGLPSVAVMIAFVLVLGFFLVKTKLKFRLYERQFLLSLVGLMVTFFVGAVIFPAQFKIWYLYSLLPLLVVVIAVVVARLVGRSLVFSILTGVYLFFYMVLNSRFSLPSEQQTAAERLKLLSEQREIVAAVIELGGDEPYAVYTYTETIYDYPYQYLFWWYRQKTGRGPVFYSYLPDKYDYVVNKRTYDPQTRGVETVILILEPNSPASTYSWESWLPTFADYEVVETTWLNGVRIEKRLRSGA